MNMTDNALEETEEGKTRHFQKSGRNEHDTRIQEKATNLEARWRNPTYRDQASPREKDKSWKQNKY